MAKTIDDLFIKQEIILKIQKKLPKLFQIADLETTRGGKIYTKPKNMEMTE